MQHYHSILSTTVSAAAVFAAFDLIGFNDQKIAAADAPVKAVALNPATEVGLDVAGMVVGFARLKVVGAVNAGNALVSAAAGGVQAAAPGNVNVFARAYSSAADGGFVDAFVFMVPPAPPAV